MKKVILTPKMAEKIQDEILYSMPSEKKIKLTGQLFVLTKKLNESITVSNGARRATIKNS